MTVVYRFVYRCDKQERVVRRRRKSPKRHDKRAHGRASINDAWGVRPKAARGGRDGQSSGMSDGGMDAGAAGRGERGAGRDERSDRRERRREGYPPEGTRPRSGLGRVARSRSDAPRLIVGLRETVSVFSTIDCITICTFVGGIGGSVRVNIGVTTDVATIIGIAVGVLRTLASSVTRR